MSFSAGNPRWGDELWGSDQWGTSDVVVPPFEGPPPQSTGDDYWVYYGYIKDPRQRPYVRTR